MTRSSDILTGGVRLGRAPKTTSKVLYHLGKGDGDGLAWYLRKMLSPDEQVKLGVAMLARADVAFTFEAGGFRWVIPSGDDIPASMLLKGEYGGEEVKAVSDWIRGNRPGTGKVVIEVGANVGTTTLPMVAAGWDVIAIEPVPATFAFLTENISNNAVGTHIEAFQVAVAAAPGTIDMVVSHSLGRSHAVGFGHGDVGERIEVTALPLDEVVRRSQHSIADIGWVWCDTNGSERIVIESGAPIWKRGIPLFAEVGPEFDLETVAEQHFRQFLPGADLEAGRAPRPIGEFAAYVRGLAVLDNVLFL